MWSKCGANVEQMWSKCGGKCGGKCGEICGKQMWKQYTVINIYRKAKKMKT